jgi:hypothetical protein
MTSKRDEPPDFRSAAWEALELADNMDDMASYDDRDRDVAQRFLHEAQLANLLRRAQVLATLATIEPRQDRS